MGIQEGIDEAHLFLCQFDSRGILWMGGYSGVATFDGFQTRYFNQKTHPDLPADHITSMYVDAGDQVWLTTALGAAVIDANGVLKSIPGISSHTIKGFVGLEGMGVAMLTDSLAYYGVEQTDRWLPFDPLNLLLKQEAISRFYAIDKHSFAIITESQRIIYVYPGKEEPQFQILDLPEPHLVISNPAGGLFIISRSEEKLWQWTPENGLMPHRMNGIFKKTVGTDPVKAALVDGPNLYVGLNTGLIVLDLMNGTYHHYRHHALEPYSLGHDISRALAVSDDGMLAIANFNGISLAALHSQQMYHRYFYPSERGTYTDHVVHEINNDQHGNLYVSNTHGVVRWRPGNSFYQEYPHTKYRLPFGINSSVYFPERDWLIIANEHHHLVAFDADMRPVHVWKDLPDKEIRLLKNYNNNLLLVGTEEGVYVFDLRTGKVSESGPLSDLHAIPPARINDILIHGDTIWIATSYSEGLYRYRVGAKEMRLYTEENGLTSNRTYSLASDGMGNMYVGTRYGLNIIRPDGSIKQITKGNGLFYDRVENLRFDRYGTLWISNTSLILTYDPSTENIKVLKESVNKERMAFRTNANTSLGDSILFFGGHNGLLYFHVDLAKEQYRPLKTAISLHDPKMGYHLVFEDYEMVLPHDRATINLSLFARDLINGNRLFFRYRMEGLGGEWSHSSHNRFVTYNLQPGQYTFHFEVSPDGQHWQTHPFPLQIQILTPLWMRWWFLLSAFFLVGAGTYSFYRWRINQLLEVESVRNRIAADLHDDVGSTLSSIQLNSQMALRKNGNGQSAYLVKISQQAVMMMETLSDIVWSLKSDQEGMEGLLIRMKEFAGEILEPAGMEYLFEGEKHLLDVKLDIEKRKNLFLIFKEAINNAAKYSCGAEIKILFTLHQNKLQMVIKDDGKGFAPKQAKKGNGLGHMRQRAEKIHARIAITSGENAGTEVHVELPVT